MDCYIYGLHVTSRNKNVQWQYLIEATTITAVNEQILNESKARGRGHGALLFNIFIFILNACPHAIVLTNGTLAFIFTEGKFVKRTMSHGTCLFTNLKCLLVLTFALEVLNSRGYFLDITKIALFHCCGLQLVKMPRMK